MATCPKCGITLDWWKVLRLHRTAALLTCELWDLVEVDPGGPPSLWVFFVVVMFARYESSSVEWDALDYRCRRYLCPVWVTFNKSISR